MKRWTKLTVICLSIVCVIFLVYVYLKGSGGKQAPTITPAIPNITQTYRGSPTITLSVKKSDFSYIDKLPFLEISQEPLTDTYARSVAVNLGFQGDPVIINDTIDGKTYFWKSNGGTLFIYLNSAKIRYTSGNSLNTVNKQLSDQAMLAVVKNSLISNKILTDGLFTVNKVTYLTQDPVNESFKETSRENASVFQVNIYPGSVTYGILATNSTENANYVQLTKDGNIYSLQLIVFGGVHDGLTNYQLKNYDQIQASLNNAVLISLGGVEMPLSQLSTDAVKEVNIDKIEIAYLIDSPTSTTLQPVYKLSGTTTLPNSNTEISAIFYLPALVGN